MSNQLISDAEALKLFFSDPVFLIPEQPMRPAVRGLATAAPVEEQIAASEPAGTASPASTFQSIGENQRGVLILVNDADHPVSTDAGAELLRNIVRHLGMRGKDFAIVNHASCPGASFDALKQAFQVRSALIFGVAPATLGLSSNENYQQYQGTDLFFGTNLKSMDPGQKRTLLNALTHFKL